METKRIFFLLNVAVLLALLGMISVLLVGRVRGYDPDVLVLIRNFLLMGGLVWLFLFLKSIGYKGRFDILVIVALLSSVGYMVQYRIKADLDSGGPGARQARTQHILRSSLRMDDAKILGMVRPEEAETVKPITLFLRSLPGWWRIFFYTFLGLFSILIVIKKYGTPERLRHLKERRIFLWLILSVGLMALFVLLSRMGTRGRFLYDMTPWEFLKVSLIVIMAGYLSHETVSGKLRELEIGWKRFRLPSSPLLVGLPLFIMLMIPQFMFVFLGDFGQIILYGVLTIFMLFIASRKYIYLIGGAAATVAATRLLLWFGGGLLPGRRFERFLIWSDLWNPSRFSSPNEWWRAAYQMVQGLFSMKAGGLFGTGLGLGYPTATPLVVQDFVYVAIVEEMGFLGGLIVVALFILLLFEGFRIALDAKDEFLKLLAAGFTIMLTIQAFVNIGGVTNLIPMTGLTLPFISRGGFSLIVCYVMVGFIMVVSHVTAVEKKA